MKLLVIWDTVFKKNSTLPSEQIPDTHKLAVAKGAEFNLLAYNSAGDKHLTCTFDKGLGSNNWNTWTVFSEHVQVDVPVVSVTSDRHISQTGLDLIKKYEGFRATAYLCPAKVWTIGYGSTHGVRPGQTITQAEAEARLRQEVEIYEDAVLKYITAPLNQNQFDALTSFCYNVGPGNLAKSSVRKYCNRKEYTRAADSLLAWNRGGGKVLAGLTRRRQEERSLFLR